MRKKVLEAFMLGGRDSFGWCEGWGAESEEEQTLDMASQSKVSLLGFFCATEDTRLLKETNSRKNCIPDLK